MHTSNERAPTRSSGRIKPGIVTMLLLIAACVVPEHGNASDMPPVPDAPCTLGERMNVHLEDGWMFECACEVLATGFSCEWNLVGQIGTALIIDRRVPKKHRIHKPKKHRFVVRHALPGIVG